MMRWLVQTVQVILVLLQIRRFRTALILVTLVYLVAFLFAIQNLTLPTGTDFAMLWADPALMFRRTGYLLFDAIAVIHTPLFTWLLAPLNLLLGLFISLLVGLNLVLSWTAWRQPRVCRVNGTTGTLGLIPALLAGGACCAPTLLLVLGIQATAALITAVQWMIPLALVLLIGSLVWVAQRTNLERLKLDLI
ncbi:hypothetical protein E4656_07815 [Natronospirillum operosum]|uniref:Uncharacterized protein n=1 Tax=Natronospirillum operosum TaxID=2759953 RepID=A0A4Z0WC10_9GAMM|nr:hypothetical protein [Natronospirillum operosum]TGG94075.1 hypothetical protein E4656_07815 [Natronospirillum operosum]